ncbi:hypothetical protein Are01nite_06960 [Actinoplanes regularis]|nr:serine/threonine-protein kinase [Actinoplanes regularis]GIE84216.1 hypothetical protein Are01nite_06960 [Actinoplanes regularis]
MGRVWLARDQMLDRDVAIKEIVPPDWMAEAEKNRLHNRTLREARSAARLTHPHVVRVYDVMHAEGLSWIVMEYVASRSLYQMLITRGPYPPVEAARIGLAVLDALTAAHRAGVLHRDIKPHNVLIGSDGRILLTDFGLAMLVDDGMITTPGLIVGSPQYVSPERARDGASTVASDLWSFGATLYAAVEGRSPFARDSAMATLAALATESPDPPQRAGPLGPILEGLLRYDPEARPGAREVERTLRAVVEADAAQWCRSPAADHPLVDHTAGGADPDEETRPTVFDQPMGSAAGSKGFGGANRVDTGDLARTSPVATSAQTGEPPGISADLESAVVGGEPPEDADDSDGWWLPPEGLPARASRRGHSDHALNGYVEGASAASGREHSSRGRSGYVEEASAASGREHGSRGRSGYVEEASAASGREHSSRARSGYVEEAAIASGRERSSPTRSGYIEGAFTRAGESSDSLVSRGPAAAAGRARSAGDHRVPLSHESSRSWPNRHPVTVGEPAVTPSLRRGNQVLVRAIPAPRSRASGPSSWEEWPPRRWSLRSRSVTRLAIAGLLAVIALGGGLLAIVVLGGRLLSIDPIGQGGSTRPVERRPASSPATPVSVRAAAFSPAFFDGRRAAGALVVPKATRPGGPPSNGTKHG